MKKVVVSIRPFLEFYTPVGTVRGAGICLGTKTLYTTRWSAKRGVRRLMKALGATNWRFEDEPDVPEPAVKGVHPWARWEATDSDGSVYEFSDRPVLGSVVWWKNSPFDLCEHVRIDERPEDFASTLRRVNV